MLNRWEEASGRIRRSGSTRNSASTASRSANVELFNGFAISCAAFASLSGKTVSTSLTMCEKGSEDNNPFG